MDFQQSDKVSDLAARLTAFVRAHVEPNEAAFRAELDGAKNRFATPLLMENLKARARAEIQ